MKNAAVKQYGVIPYIKKSGKWRLVLITSRTHGNWIFPKGGPMEGKSKQEAALREAYEEAGVKGRIVGRYAYSSVLRRGGRKIELTLYPMRVEKLLSDWPEKAERRRIVVPLKAARSMMEYPALKRSLQDWMERR